MTAKQSLQRFDADIIAGFVDKYSAQNAVGTIFLVRALAAKVSYIYLYLDRRLKFLHYRIKICRTNIVILLILGSVRVCNDCNEREKQRLLSTTLANLSHRNASSPSGSGILARHLLAAPNSQLSGSRGSLHSESHSSASTPGIARHRLRTISVYGGPGINRNIEQGSEIGTGIDSLSVANKFNDRRQRKISAPSSVHPFRLITTDLDSPIENESEETQEHAIRKPSFSVSSRDFLKSSKKFRVLMNQIAESANKNGIPLETHRYTQKLYHCCFLGRDLIQWLIKRDVDTQYDTAVAIGQALLDFNYLQDLSVTSVTQSDASFKAEFNADKPYRPDVISTSLEEVLLPAASFLSATSLKPPPGRKMTIFHETPLASTSQESIEKSREKVSVRAVTEDEEDHIDGPEWFQDLITTNGNGQPTAASLANLDTSDQSNDAKHEDDNKSTNVKKDSGATFGQDLPEFQKSANSDNLNVDNIDCTELDKIYLNHQLEYTKKLLEQENISANWLKPIIEYVTTIVKNIKIDYSTGDNMDIREHVKIKRIPGGAIEDSLIINGEVFSGRVARNGMPLNLDNPNLLLISESIGYPRHDKLVSLENLPAQQDEYVKNVVHKLKSFNPDVILSESGICNGTQDGLHDANIAVILRVKSKVLTRLERLFGTTKIDSLDSTHQAPPVSSCYRYSNKSFVLNDLSRRNYILLENAKEMRGCTVLLRGGTAYELSCVKRVIKRMLLVRHSAKYEKSFLLTEYCQADRFQQSAFSYNDCPLRQMTLSPFVRVPNMRKLTDNERKSNERENEKVAPIDLVSSTNGQKQVASSAKTITENEKQMIKKGIPKYADPQAIEKTDKDANNILLRMNPNVTERESKPELVTTILTSGIEDRNVRNMLASFRANNCSRPTNNNKSRNTVLNEVCDEDLSSSIPEYFKELEDKKLPLVYSSHSPVSRVSPQYCVKPWVTGMAFYGNDDIPIGAYLEEFCLNDDVKCPNEDCTSPMRDHIRRFVLEDICVTLKVQEAEENMMVLNCESDKIQTWRYCPTCKLVTPILILNTDAWMLSFAMFFSLLIYEENLTRRGASFDICQHSIHREHHICFLKGDMLASFKVSHIQLHDLVMPSPHLVLPSKIPTQEQLSNDLTNLNNCRQSLFNQINDKLNKIKAETHGPSLTGAITLHLTEAVKDFETLKKYADEIDANIRTGTQLNEMRISILMLKVSLLKTISRWKSKLISLADIKKKEDKSVGNIISRHPSGNNLSGTPSLQIIPTGYVFDATSQSSADLPNIDGHQGHTDLSAKLSANSSVVDENISTTNISSMKTETRNSMAELDDSCIDIVNSSYNLKSKDLNLEEIPSSTAPPATVLQPSYTHNVVAVSKAKWNSRESSNSLDFQLLSPFSATIHADLYLKPGVLVDESQPSSVIAYTLASNDYRNFVENSTSHQSIEESNIKDASENSNEVLNKHTISNEKQGDGTKQKDNDDTLKHFKHSFRDDTCDFYCKVLFAKEFETYRERTLNSGTDLILSLSECSRFKASGGKSGVKFFKTIDGRFLLKELSRRTEARDVSTFIPKYIDYVTNAHKEGTSNTLLAKIFGVFDVGYKNHETGRQSGIMFVLMENLTYDRPNITESYDLKGSRRYKFLYFYSQ